MIDRTSSGIYWEKGFWPLWSMQIPICNKGGQAEEEDLHSAHWENLAIGWPCPMLLQTENWVFAPLAFGWLTCTADQRSLGLQTTYKEPQIFKNLGLETLYTCVYFGYSLHKLCVMSTHKGLETLYTWCTLAIVHTSCVLWAHIKD